MDDKDVRSDGKDTMDEDTIADVDEKSSKSGYHDQSYGLLWRKKLWIIREWLTDIVGNDM